MSHQAWDDPELEAWDRKEATKFRRFVLRIEGFVATVAILAVIVCAALLMNAAG